MQLVHCHWQPPHSESEGSVVVWGESALVERPRRDRRIKRPQPHPYTLPPPQVAEGMRLLCGYQVGRQAEQITLWLPTADYGPTPSPQLLHDWEPETPDLLLQWQIDGLRLSPVTALAVLLRLESHPRWQLADDARFWQAVMRLAVEALALQKVLPVLSQPQADRFEARWQARLTAPADLHRLDQLQAAMPPLCQAAAADPQQPLSAASLIDSFINAVVDAQMRGEARKRQPRFQHSAAEPAGKWLRALFSSRATLNIPSAQAIHLRYSFGAWTRMLTAAGDSHVRVLFRLQAPEQATDPWRLSFWLQSRSDPTLMVEAASVWRAGSVLSALERQISQPQLRLLTGLGFAAQIYEPLRRGIDRAHPVDLQLSSEEAYDFLRDVAPLLEQSGFGIMVPPWWSQRNARLGVRLKIDAQQTSSGLLSLDNLFGFRWELSIGEQTLTRAEFEALVALKSPLVQIRGEWVRLDADQIERAIAFYKRQMLADEVDLLGTLRLALDADAAVEGLPLQGVDVDAATDDLLKRLQNEQKLQPIAPPDGLHATLRDYQRYGFSWLVFLQRLGLGAILADDMGLGKTIQALALFLYWKEQTGRLPGPLLLICPTSVVTNWDRERARFTPGLSAYVHQGSDRLRDDDFSAAACTHDLVLTSFALARRDSVMLQAIDWHAVVLDEAQNIKNPHAKQTQAIRALSARHRLALTGTPVENRLSELWSIMHFLNPGYLGTSKQFQNTFALPIAQFGDETAMQRLRRLTGPFILRRVKTDPTVIRDLPAKQEVKVYVNLSEEQATLYESVVRGALQQIEESEEGIGRRGLVLSMLMQLKQICNHPAHFLHQLPTQQISAGETQRSGKLQRLQELLDTVVAEEDSVLIFTQFSEMGAFLQRYVQQRLGLAAVYLHGGTPVKRRPELIDRFQSGAAPVFILSLKAGGTGLNLTRANHVFHFDRWWNPAVEDQATDRAFRIGQKRNVFVHKFVTVGTLEEQIDEMIEQKKRLATQVIGQGEAWLTELDSDHLRDLVSLRRETLA